MDFVTRHDAQDNPLLQSRYREAEQAAPWLMTTAEIRSKARSFASKPRFGKGKFVDEVLQFIKEDFHLETIHVNGSLTGAYLFVDKVLRRRRCAVALAEHTFERMQKEGYLPTYGWWQIGIQLALKWVIPFLIQLALDYWKEQDDKSGVPTDV